MIHEEWQNLRMAKSNNGKICEDTIWSGYESNKTNHGSRQVYLA